MLLRTCSVWPIKVSAGSLLSQMMTLRSWLPLATAPAGNRVQGGIAQHVLTNFSWPKRDEQPLSVSLSSQLDHKRTLWSRDALTRLPEWVDATERTWERKCKTQRRKKQAGRKSGDEHLSRGREGCMNTYNEAFAMNAPCCKSSTLL